MSMILLSRSTLRVRRGAENLTASQTRPRHPGPTMHSPRSSVVAGALMATVLSACASAPKPADTAIAALPPLKPIVQKGSANLITEDEIAALGGSVQTAFQVVQRLRPAMLRVRAGQTTGTAASDGIGSSNAPVADVSVYLNGQRLGGLSSLDQITVRQIRQIRYFNANDATTLLGTGNTGGAIQIIQRP